MFPPVRGLHEMVGAANNFEVEAGYRMLTQGGNAVDAGVASVLAATVTEQSRFGLGGEMPLLVKMAGKPVIAISGIGVAPAKATVDYYAHRQPEPWEEPGTCRPSRCRASVRDHARRFRRADSGADSSTAPSRSRKWRSLPSSTPSRAFPCRTSSATCCAATSGS